jgi:hypothetical protein
VSNSVRPLSSSRTYFAKKVLPWFVATIATGFVLTIGFALSHSRGVIQARAVLMLLFTMGMSGFVVANLRRQGAQLVDAVDDLGELLLVRNDGREARVPLSNVINIGYRQTGFPRVTLTLRAPCIFGREVHFLIEGGGSATHSVIDQLIRRADEARLKAAAPALVLSPSTRENANTRTRT